MGICMQISEKNNMTKSVVTFCIASCMAILPSAANAQWRIGLTGGATINHYTIDKHYMEDWHYSNGWGTTFGISSQYNFLKLKKMKVGVRADLNWLQKNHREYRTTILDIKVQTESGNLVNPIDFKVKNDYIQLPIMATVNYGGRFHCFADVGFYGGYWCKSSLNGRLGEAYSITEVVAKLLSDNDKDFIFDNERDQRYEFGLVGGIGGGWRFANHWDVQIEVLWYRGLTSTQKNYMRTKDPRYNDTFVFQAGLYWTIKTKKQ